MRSLAYDTLGLGFTDTAFFSVTTPDDVALPQLGYVLPGWQLSPCRIHSLVQRSELIVSSGHAYLASQDEPVLPRLSTLCFLAQLRDSQSPSQG